MTTLPKVEVTKIWALGLAAPTADTVPLKVYVAFSLSLVVNMMSPRPVAGPWKLAWIDFADSDPDWLHMKMNAFFGGWHKR